MSLINKTLSLLIVWMTAIYPYPFNLEPQALASEFQPSELEKRQPPAYSAEEVQKNHDAKVAMANKLNEEIKQNPDAIAHVTTPTVIEGTPPQPIIETVDEEKGIATVAMPTVIEGDPPQPIIETVDEEKGLVHVAMPTEGDKPIGPPGVREEKPIHTGDDVVVREGETKFVVASPGTPKDTKQPKRDPRSDPPVGDFGNKEELKLIGGDKPIGPPGIGLEPINSVPGDEKPKGAELTATYELIPLPQGEGIDDRTADAVGPGADPALKDASVDSIGPRTRRDGKDEDEWVSKSNKRKLTF